MKIPRMSRNYEGEFCLKTKADRSRKETHQGNGINPERDI